MKTIRLKVKSESYSWLNKAAIEVNQVWNWANETSIKALDKTKTVRKWLTGFELNNLSSGASKYFEYLTADVIQRINSEYTDKRFQSKKIKLRWRVSSGSRRSLGWIPFKAPNIRLKGNAVRFAGKTFRVFESHRLQDIKWKSGCFAQDAMGDWWLCLPVEVEQTQDVAPKEMVGIDLGLKSTATTSDGDVLEAGRYYRDIEQKIAQAQRRGHKKQAKRLHRKAANCRKDALHKFSRKIVNDYQNIIIGNVSSSKLAKTTMAKAVNDSGWRMLKTQLQYKGQQAGRNVEIVNEAFTTKACSNCGSLSGPSGLDKLSVREWTCPDCGTGHDRDVNAAKNILRLRYQPPLAGTSQRLVA